MLSKIKTLTLLAITSLMLLTVYSCKEKNDNWPTSSAGKITGFDMRKCMCCGGWYVEIANTTYRIPTLPPSSTLDMEKEKLPVNVWLDWSIDPNRCLGDEIIVSRIEKR